MQHQLIELSLLRGGFTTLAPEMVAPAYAESLVATNYLVDWFGMPGLQEFFELLKGGLDESAAFRRAFSISEQEFESRIVERLGAGSRG